LRYAAGVIESSFSPGSFSMQLSSKVYGLAWRFKEEGLRADLEKRWVVILSVITVLNEEGLLGLQRLYAGPVTQGIICTSEGFIGKFLS
jgi:hypothetical protein